MIETSIARENLQLVVSKIANEQDFNTALDFLIPKDESEPFWKALVYTNSWTLAIKGANHLRSKLPEVLKKKKMGLIRVYTADLSDKRKELHMDALRNDECWIIFCTEACGMGINVKNIDVVVQWGVSPILTSSQLNQHFGRAGRDRNQKALGVVFAPAYMFLAPTPIIKPAFETMDSEAGNDAPTSTRTKAKSADGRSLVDREIYDQYTMAVQKESLDEVFEFLAELREKSVRPAVKGKGQSTTTSWTEVDGTLTFFLNTKGCRANVFLVIFNDVSLRDGVVLLREDCCECSLDLRDNGEMEIRHGLKLKECLRWQDRAGKTMACAAYRQRNR